RQRSSCSSAEGLDGGRRGRRQSPRADSQDGRYVERRNHQPVSDQADVASETAGSGDREQKHRGRRELARTVRASFGYLKGRRPIPCRALAVQEETAPRTLE